jgi:hypothetical protein
MKNRIYLVSPAQSEKKLSAKTVIVLYLSAPNMNRRDKILFCPGHIGTKQFCPRKRFLSPGQAKIKRTSVIYQSNVKPIIVMSKC